MLRFVLVVLALVGSVVAAPVVQTISPAPGSSPASLTQISITFSQAVSGVDAEDLLVKGEAPATVSGSGAGPYVWTFTEPLPGIVSVSFDANTTITDLAGELFVPGDGWEYTLEDSVAPAILSTTPAANATVGNVTQVEVVFTENVTGVSADDLRINGTPAVSVTGSGAGPYLFSFAQPPAGAVSFTWAAEHGITDTSPAANVFGGAGWNVTRAEGGAGTLVITEFLAANGTGLLDENGDNEDWMEVHNPGSTTVNLAGWSLTENDNNLRKWTFPARSLGPGAYLVVFASGKDRRPLTGNLHASFKLNENGGYLALVGPEFPAAVISSFAPEYPGQRYDYSYGRTGSLLRYFSPPTPGAANSSSTAFSGVTPPPQFSVARGIFTSPFQLVLTSANSAATIRYTTNGSPPTATNGLTYSGPLNVTQTAVIRAVAFGSGTVPSETVTQSYISVDGVLGQQNNPPGYPSTWGSGTEIFSPARSDNRVPADYEMDPQIVNDLTVRGGKTNAQRIRESFAELPVMSVVMSINDMFGSNGLYPNSTVRGDFEKPCSVEMILPGNETAFATSCGIRMHGNASRLPHNNPKHAFKLKFRGDYGASKLEYRLFPDSPIEEFDDIVLRADYNSSWRHWSEYQRNRGVRLRDAWSKDTARAMDVVAGHNRYVHLFINGIYWGTYDPTEQLTEDFGAAYLGGDNDEYDVYDQGSRKAGTSTVYNAMIGIPSPIDNSRYEQMKQFLDVPEFTDYMLHHFFIGHEDWGADINKNWYAMRHRSPGGRFKYIPWDQENILWEPSTNRVTVSYPPSGLHPKLITNAQYRLDFADRVHRHMVAPNGALQPVRNIARWQARRAEMDNAQVAESARWGDYRRDVHQFSEGNYPLFTRENHAEVENNRMVNTYFPQRTAVVLNQLRAAALYPQLDAPEYRKSALTGEILGSQHVAPGTQIFLRNPDGAGTILYTTDGKDPRVVFSGATAATAQPYSGPIAVNASVIVKSRVLFGTTWSALNEATFTVGSMASPIRITEIMYNPPGGAEYEFLELENITTQRVSLSGWHMGGIEFFFPIGTELREGERIVLASNDNPAAWAGRYQGVVPFGHYGGALDNSGERISLRDAAGRTMLSVNYDNQGNWPLLADGKGYSLEVVDPLGDPDSPWNWRAVTQDGTPGRGNSSVPPPAVVISEVLATNSGAVMNGTTSPDYVELHNPGESPVDIGGWRLVTTNQMVIPGGTTIPAGGYLVIWCDSNFGAPGLHTGGNSLQREKGDIALYPGGASTPADAVRYGAQIINHSIGRIGEEWRLVSPSPAAANVALPVAPPAVLKLNEWLASSDAPADDFVELYNTHDTLPVPLQGLQIQAGAELHQIMAPAFIAPRGFVSFDADENPGADHVNFKLPAAGATLALLDAFSAVLDTVTYGPQLSMISQGRILDGAATIFGGLTPSPGAPNVLPPAPSITQSPDNAAVPEGTDVNFSVTAAGSNPLTYQWRHNGEDLPGKTGATLALEDVTAEDGGLYTCMVRNTAGQAISAPARLTIQISFEQWRETRFTPAELGDPAISGLAADFDRDGLTTLQEFFHGLDPKVVDGAAGAIAQPKVGYEEGPPRYVTLTFRRSAAAYLSAVDLEVASTPDAATWSVEAPDVVEQLSVDPNSGDLMLRWKLELEPGELRKFLRLRLRP